jgi:hypothetical protein
VSIGIRRMLTLSILEYCYAGFMPTKEVLTTTPGHKEHNVVQYKNMV